MTLSTEWLRNEEDEIMNDNTTPLTAGEYNAKIGKIIPYYEEFHKQILDIVKQKGQIESWLDVGCGTGVFESMILEDYPDVKLTAIDPSEQMLMEAKRLVSEEKVTYVCRTSESIDFSEEFDVVTAVQVHHYLREEERELASGLFMCFGRAACRWGLWE